MPMALSGIGTLRTGVSQEELLFLKACEGSKINETAEAETWQGHAADVG